jgi:uncharacterized protein
LNNTEIAAKVDSTIKRIRQISAGKSVNIAFSGGLDSTLVLFLAKEALGKDRMKAVNVDFGQFTYKRAARNVNTICENMQVELYRISGEREQKELMKRGPDCNLCTKKIKLGLIKAYSKEGLVLTGSNQSDSWGKYGTDYFSGFFAPLFTCSKEEVGEMANYLDLKIERIGENAFREGCKLKHLLKPLVNPDYHGKAVSLANEILLDKIKELNIYSKMANAKIIGPLSKNIALINIFPLPASQKHLKTILDSIASIEQIDSCTIVSKPLQLTIKADKGQFNNLRSRYWIEQGRLQPEFAAPLKFRWLLTTNHRLKTFQVVDYNCRKGD